ncbi:MAG: tryptophanase [Ignavibacteria bacterium]|nr:tryptophanase [Ignavibacteria bacterium]
MHFEPFKIKVVEPIPVTTREYRKSKLKDAHYNLFLLRSDDITIDLLTDSGTGAMSSKQWSAVMDGDEAYAGSRSYYKFEETVRSITGFKHIIPTHQGRAAERILFSILGGKGKMIPSNTHFDTTRANIEYTGAEAFDFPTSIALKTDVLADFKGNIDIERLENFLKSHSRQEVPLIMLTVTNNSGGGQPVSMENIRKTSEIARSYGIPFFIDCCRFAENAYFIKTREKGYETKSIEEIAREMFSYADGCLMSAKKDGLSNTGGFIATNIDDIAEKAKVLLIVTEGFLTYGGLARRDLEALAVGMKEALDEKYLEYRINQVKFLGNELLKRGIPILVPTGGHAVYLDAKRFAPHIPCEQFPGQSIACEIYLEGGVRTVEIGSLMFGKYDKDKHFVTSPFELVRLAIPRRVYTNNHLEYVAEVIGKVYEKRDQLKGMQITYEAPYLRHFTAHLEYLQ